MKRSADTHSHNTPSPSPVPAPASLADRVSVRARRSGQVRTQTDLSGKELRLLAAKLEPVAVPPPLPLVRTKRARLTCSESGLAELASSLQQLQVKPDETVAVTVCPLTQVRLASGRVVRQYQADIVFWTERVEGGLVCAEMGLGKTCVALLCLARYLDPSLKTDLGDPKARAASPCLVVASSEETIVEWTNELRYFPSLVWTQLDLDKPCPELGLVITTYDALATAMERIKADVKAELKAEQAEKKEPAFDADLFETLLRSTVFGVSFGLVIGDELQKVANKDTRWHQAMCRLQAQRKFGLSGTPLSNSVRDVRAQLKFCLGPKVVARLQDSQLKEYIFVLDCAQAGVAMPNKNVNLRRLELDPETRGLYKRVDGSGLRKIVRMGILRQVCIAASLASDVLHKYGLDAGLRAWLDDAKSSAGLGSPKMLVLAEQLHVVCVDQKEQLLVFSTSAKALSLGMHAVPSGVEAEMICDEVPKPERKQIVKRFKQGAVRVLFLTYKLGSEGLNFQNCCHELTLDDWWTDSSRSQAHARTFRSGQERDVSITRLQIRDSVDEHVAAVARRKGRAQAALLGKEVQL